ncbi:hypothetical protein AB0436_04330 [Streptomyces sp. NPDC051322]|uniref:hypothetical protein n=1 Tax=Streptomyces sp. NPDC051322 TaxID=3154645 RepID=UPI0034506B78
MLARRLLVVPGRTTRGGLVGDGLPSAETDGPQEPDPLSEDLRPADVVALTVEAARGH